MSIFTKDCGVLWSLCTPMIRCTGNVHWGTYVHMYVYPMYKYQTLLTQELSAAEVLGGAVLVRLKASRNVSKNDKIYTSCAMQLQLVSKLSWSKQIVKWLPTPMSPPHNSCSAFSSHWSPDSCHHGDPGSLLASSWRSFTISLRVPLPIDPKEAYLSSSPVGVFSDS